MYLFRLVISGYILRIEIARSHSNSIFSLLRNLLFILSFSGTCHPNSYWFLPASPTRLRVPYKKGQALPTLEFTFSGMVPGAPSVNSCSTERLQIVLWGKDWYFGRFNSKSWTWQKWIWLFHFLPSSASYSLLTWRCNPFSQVFYLIWWYRCEECAVQPLVHMANNNV